MADFTKIKNLVFEGCGVGAIAYAGFIVQAVRRGLLSLGSIQRVAGVSSGAIAGLQIALNYTAIELMQEMKAIDFKKLVNNQPGWLASLRRILNLFVKEGLYSENHLYQYVGRLIKAKTGDENIRFHELQAMKKDRSFKDFYVVATKLFLLKGQPIAMPMIFSHEHTPDARVIDAVSASAALPIIFPPIRLLESADGQFVRDPRGHLFVDGGILKAYPIRIFDDLRYIAKDASRKSEGAKSVFFNPETLGLRIESPANLDILQCQDLVFDGEVIHSWQQQAESFLYVFRSGQQEASYAASADQKRSIVIDSLGISSTDFNMSDEEKAALYQSGEKAAQRLSTLLSPV